MKNSGKKIWGVLGKQQSFVSNKVQGQTIPLNANPLESWDVRKSRYKRVDLVPKAEQLMENIQQGGVVPSISITPSPSATPNLTPSVTPTETSTATPTPSVTSTATPTPSVTPTETSTATPTPSVTSTATPTPSVTSTATPTPSVTPTETVTPTNTSTPTPSPSPTGSTFDADYQAVLNYATSQGWTLPSASGQTLQNDLVVSLKSGSTWSDLDIFYVTATDGDSDFATINWKNPGTYNLSKNGGLTYTSNIGFSGNSVNAYLDTGFILSGSTLSGTPYNNSMGAWVDLNPTNAGNIIGSFETERTQFMPNFQNSYLIGNIGINAGGGGDIILTNPPQTDGFWVVTRTEDITNSAKTASYIYVNNSYSGGCCSYFKSATTLFSSVSISLLARKRSSTTQDQYSNAIVKSAYIGRETVRTDLYNALNTYITSI